MTTKTKKMTLTGLMTAVICILGPISFPLPISPVPVSLGILGILLSVYLLGMVGGTCATLLYLLLGFIGLPVFTGFTGGAGKLLGPTGGYMIGYLFLTLLSGFFIGHFKDSLPMHILGMILGVLVCHIFGSIWLSFLLNISFGKALALGSLPYIPAEAVKILITLSLGCVVRPQLRRAGLL